MKTNKQLITLLIFLLLGFACTTYMDELEENNLQTDETQQTVAPDVANFYIGIIEGTYPAGTMVFQGEEIGLGGEYYYPAIGQNLPLIIIAHGDGMNGALSYDEWARSLASEGYFVACVDRTGISLEHEATVEAFYTLLRKNLKALYSEFNGETILNHTSYDDEAISNLISHDVLLIGHSAGGRDVFYKGKSAVNGLHGLYTKAIIGVAPTLGLVNGLGPDLSGTPYFIIQGNADYDNVSNASIGYADIHYELSSVKSKVGLFESPTIYGNVERAYILKGGGHKITGLTDPIHVQTIQPHTDLVFYTKAIASAYLKNMRADFDQYIRHQNETDLLGHWSNILYWNGMDDVYYVADNSGILLPGQKAAIKTSEGLDLEEVYSQELLGSTESSKTLHWTNVLKIEKDNVFSPEKYPDRTLKFTFNESVDITKSYLRFNAGELYNFDLETYDDENIDPAIRLIYAVGKTEEHSNWIQMSDLQCGAIQSAEFGLYIERNIMQTYVVPLSSFNKAPIGSHIIAVEFDFTHAIGEKTVLLDDLGFMD